MGHAQTDTQSRSPSSPHPLDDKENPGRAYEWAMDTEHKAEWLAFREWENEAAKKGSGLTKAQLEGALLFHEWLRKERRGG